MLYLTLSTHHLCLVLSHSSTTQFTCSHNLHHMQMLSTVCNSAILQPGPVKQDACTGLHDNTIHCKPLVDVWVSTAIGQESHKSNVYSNVYWGSAAVCTHTAGAMTLKTKGVDEVLC